MRVAIACSGLGHVQRGIESWATDLAHGLRGSDIDVALFGGARSDEIAGVPCLRRTGATNRLLTRGFRHLGGWRYGLGSPYEIEQTSFALSLWPKIRRGFDLLHVQDPLIAQWFERAHRLGLSRARVIYANGTGEGSGVQRRFRHLQLLTAQAEAEWRAEKPVGQSVFMIPNFIDTALFTPGDKLRARAQFGLPADRPIILCCAAIRRHHKRIDYLLAEFQRLREHAGHDALLVVAGGSEADTQAVIAEGKAALGDQVRFFPDVPRANMPDLYRTADIFTLASLHEMFGIVLLEAMASGLPVVCHDSPNFRAIVGPAGSFHDASRDGGLAAGIAPLLDPATREALARQARQHVDQQFSEQAVLPGIIAMYHAVLRSEPRQNAVPPRSAPDAPSH